MRKRGVALLWSLVLSAVLLIISSTMVSYVIKESRFSVNIEESTVAYAAAKSGIEWGLDKRITGGAQGYETKKLDLIDTADGINDTTVVINPSSPDCVGGTLISSESASGVVTRRLEYCFTESPPNIIRNSVLGGLGNATITPSNYNSFEMSFDFWLEQGKPISGIYYFGLENSGRSENLKFGIELGGKLSLSYLSGGAETKQYIGTNIYNEIDHYKPYVFRAKIQYIEDTAANLLIEKRHPTTGVFSCLGTTTLNLSSGRLDSNLNQLITTKYSAPLPGADNVKVTYVTDGPQGDGTYILYYDKGENLYIDNVVFEN